jgi:hypothetical protein
MTALGAGTALSTLHSLGRGVVVLHGHKHHPAVRLLKGLGDEADVLVTSAGSCGRAQDLWSGGAGWEDAPKLGPSLNVVEVTADGVEVTSQAWSPTEPTRRNSPHQLVSVRRQGRRWELRAPHRPRPFEPVLALNKSVVRVRAIRARDHQPRARASPSHKLAKSLRVSTPPSRRTSIRAFTRGRLGVSGGAAAGAGAVSKPRAKWAVRHG